MVPVGPDGVKAFSRGYFELAAAQQPKPATVAMIAADAEFARTAADGAKENAKALGFSVIYDRSYPPSTTDFGPIMRAVQAANADLVFVAAYPPDTVGIVRAAREVGLTAKMFGGTMIGLLATPLKTQLGPAMNNIVIMESFVPTFDFPGLQDLLSKYRAKAAGQQIDPFGYGFAPFGYAAGQILAQAVTETKSLDHDKIAKYIHATTFKTVAGEIAYNKRGRLGAAAYRLHPVPGCAAEQCRAVSRRGEAADPLAAAIQERHDDLPVRGSEALRLVNVPGKGPGSLHFATIVCRTWQRSIASDGMPTSVAELYRIELAPLPQRAILGFRLEIVPPIEHAPVLQQIPESGVGAAPAENLPNLVEVVGQKFAGEVQRQRLAEIELPLVGDPEVFVVVLDAVRQFLDIIQELGMPMDLARLLAQKGLVLAHAVAADELEGQHDVLEADRHWRSPRCAFASRKAMSWLKILHALREGGVPDFFPVLVENQPRFSRRDRPVTTRELALELAGSPARIAECDQALLRTVAVADVVQDFAARRHGDAPVDVDGSGPMVIAAVNDEAHFGLDRTAGKDADRAGDRHLLLAEHLQET